MSARAKAVTIVAIVWVAAMVTIGVSAVATRPKDTSAARACWQRGGSWDECTAIEHGRSFDWASTLALVGGVTLVSLVVLAIGLVMTSSEARQ